jgi:hypothetical protein
MVEKMGVSPLDLETFIEAGFLLEETVGEHERKTNGSPRTSTNCRKRRRYCDWSDSGARAYSLAVIRRKRMMTSECG